MEIRDFEQDRFLPEDPFFALQALTGRAVPVAARVVPDPEKPAVTADMDMPAQGSSPALLQLIEVVQLKRVELGRTLDCRPVIPDYSAHAVFPFHGFFLAPSNNGVSGEWAADRGRDPTMWT